MEACVSQGRVVELPFVVNWCTCSGEWGRVTCLPSKEKGGPGKQQQTTITKHFILPT